MTKTIGNECRDKNRDFQISVVENHLIRLVQSGEGVTRSYTCSPSGNPMHLITETGTMIMVERFEIGRMHVNFEKSVRPLGIQNSRTESGRLSMREYSERMADVLAALAEFKAANRSLIRGIISAEDRLNARAER